MKLFKLNFVSPLGKMSFILHVLFSLILQACSVLFALLLFQIGSFQYMEVSTIFYLVFIIIVTFCILFYMWDIDKYRARFKDIYPDHNLNLFLLILYLFIPFAFIAMTIFLCLKDSESPGPPPKIFKIQNSILAIVPLIIFQIASPLIAYWTASPSTYFTVDAIHVSLEIIHSKRNTELSDEKVLIEKYQRAASHKLSAVQLVLLIAVDTAMFKKERKRTIAGGGDTKEASFKYGLQVLDACHKSLLMSENARLDFLDYSPMHWFYPSGPYEIFFLSLAEQNLLNNFNEIMLNKNLNLLNQMENQVFELSSPRKEFYLKEITEFRKKFALTKTFISKS